MTNKDNAKIKENIQTMFIIQIIMMIILLVNTSVLISNKSSGNGNKVLSGSGNNGDYDVSAFTEVKPKELVEKTKGENTVVYIGRASCSWCVKFVPILTDATKKYKMNTLHIDLAKIIDFVAGSISDSENYKALGELKTIEKLDGYMKENLGATPMVLIIKDGVIVDAQTGFAEADAFDSFLKDNDFK